MNNDQWFEPGAKVSRVATADQLGVIPCDDDVEAATDFGITLCVEECWTYEGRSRVTFVGVPCQPDESWLAACFRKVSEIQLCVRAAKRISNPIESQPA